MPATTLKARKASPPAAQPTFVEEFSRPGKHTVRVGDQVRVAGNEKGRGWVARVHRLEVAKSGRIIAWVSPPGGKLYGGLRYIDASRLTRKKAKP